MTGDERASVRTRFRPLVLCVVGCLLVGASLVGCRSAGRQPVATEGQIEAARQRLSRPLPGDLAALYRLRVPSTGGLRLSVLTVADRGRVTISEPFGSALSLTAWSQGQPTVVFDLRENCRYTTDDLSGVLGVGNLPLPQAVRLLGGRLPAVTGDRIEILSDGRLQVAGERWRGIVTLAPDPWRVIEVEDVTDPRRPGWAAELGDHTSSVPGWLRVDGLEGRWAELELSRLEWSSASELPPLPELPVCGSGETRRSSLAEPVR